MKMFFLLFVIGAAAVQGWGGIGQDIYGGIGIGGWGGQGIAGLHKYGGAPIGHDGRVVDTPEVARAKAAHLQALAAASHGKIGGGGLIGAGGGYIGGGWGQGGYGAGYIGQKWHGPIAHIELTHDGKFVKDTPEVAHAKQQHLAALAAAKGGHYYGQQGIGGGYGIGIGAGIGGDHSGQYKGEGEELGQYKGEGLAEGQYQGEGIHGGGYGGYYGGYGRK